MEEGLGKHADERLRAARNRTIPISHLNRLRALSCIGQIMRDDRIEMLARCTGADAEARRIAEAAIAKARLRD